MDFDQFFSHTDYKFPRALRTSDKPIPVPISEVIEGVAKHAGAVSAHLTRLELGKHLLGDYRPKENGKSYDGVAVSYFETFDKDAVNAVTVRSSVVVHELVERHIAQCKRTLEIARQCMSALSVLSENEIGDVNIYRNDKGMKEAFMKAVGVDGKDFNEARAARENVMLQIIRQAQPYQKGNKSEPRAAIA